MKHCSQWQIIRVLKKSCLHYVVHENLIDHFQIQYKVTIHVLVWMRGQTFQRCLEGTDLFSSRGGSFCIWWFNDTNYVCLWVSGLPSVKIQWRWGLIGTWSSEAAGHFPRVRRGDELKVRRVAWSFTAIWDAAWHRCNTMPNVDSFTKRQR